MPALNYSRPSFHNGAVLVDGRRIGSVGQAIVEGHTVQFGEIVLNELLQDPAAETDLCADHSVSVRGT